MTMGEFRPLTDIELEAIQAFALEHGRTWRMELSTVYWYNARLWRPKGRTEDTIPGSVLHGLRNSHGPDWLYSVKLPKT